MNDDTRKLKLPDLIEECLLACQDDQPGLFDKEAAEVMEIVRIVREHRIGTARGLEIRLNRERRLHVRGWA